MEDEVKPPRVRKGGRNPKLANPDLIKKLTQLIQAGCYVYVAAEAVGIGERSFYRWMARGEEETSGMYRQFWQEIKKAEAVAEAKMLMVINEASRTNWTAAAWFLERKFPDRWGRKDRVQIDASVTNNDVSTTKQNMIEWVNGLSDEEIERLNGTTKTLN